MARPSDLAANEEGDVADPADDSDTPDAIVPFEKSARMMVATRDILTGDSALGAISTLDQSAPHPMDLLGSDQVLTAYAPEMKTDPGAEQALRMIIARETTATAPVRTASLTPAPITPAAAAPIDAGIRPAALGGTNGLNLARISST